MAIFSVGMKLARASVPLDIKCPLIYMAKLQHILNILLILYNFCLNSELIKMI